MKRIAVLVVITSAAASETVPSEKPHALARIHEHKKKSGKGKHSHKKSGDAKGKSKFNALFPESELLNDCSHFVDGVGLDCSDCDASSCLSCVGPMHRHFIDGHDGVCKVCPPNCKNGVCGGRGKCTDGCIDGWTGSHCLAQSSTSIERIRTGAADGVSPTISIPAGGFSHANVSDKEFDDRRVEQEDVHAVQLTDEIDYMAIASNKTAYDEAAWNLFGREEQHDLDLIHSILAQHNLSTTRSRPSNSSESPPESPLRHINPVKSPLDVTAASSSETSAGLKVQHVDDHDDVDGLENSNLTPETTDESFSSQGFTMANDDPYSISNVARVISTSNLHSASVAQESHEAPPSPPILVDDPAADILSSIATFDEDAVNDDVIIAQPNRVAASSGSTSDFVVDDQGRFGLTLDGFKKLVDGMAKSVENRNISHFEALKIVDDAQGVDDAHDSSGAVNPKTRL